MAERFSYEMLIPHEEMLGGATAPYSEEEIGRTSYRPTVVIGLGGTGYNVIRKLKRRIQQHFGEERAAIFQYIVFDTAPESPPVGEIPLGTGEFVYLPGFPANEMIQGLDDKDPISKWWMRPHVPDFVGNGAGAIRAVGRLVFAHYASTIIVPRLQAKIRRAVAIGTDRRPDAQSIKVYIVCSVAGGTGSGTLLDMAYIARDELMKAVRVQSFITGVIVMPSAYMPLSTAPIQGQRYRANGYAALRELDLHQARRKFTMDYGAGYKVGPKVNGMRPFDITYLISLFNQNGQALSNVDALTEMIAEEMMLEIASPLSGATTNVLDNVQETDSSIEGHPTAYSSFAVSAILYPLRGVASWCGLKHETSFVRQVLLNPVRSAEDSDREANDFVDQLQLREEGADQVVNGLNVAGPKKEAINVRQLEYGAFDGIPNSDILDTFQREMPTGIESVQQAKRHIIARLHELQVVLPPLISQKVNTMVRDPERGPRYAEWFLNDLEAKLRAYRTAHMLAEQAQFQTQLTSAQARLDPAREELERALGMPAILPWRSHAISNARNAYISTFNDRLYAEHQAILRENAVKLYDATLDKVVALAANVKELIAAFTKEADDSARISEQARVRLKVTQSKFSLVKSVVTEQKLLETYEKYKPLQDTPEQRSNLLREFWTFFGRRAPGWELGRGEVAPEGEAAQVFYFLGEYIGARLAEMPLLERMAKELYATHGQSRDQAWRQEIQERFTQAAPFWNPSIIRRSDKIMQYWQKSPRLVGYGEDEAETQWATKFADVLGEQVHAVQTKNDQEVVFLRTEHALPLFAVHEVDAELRGDYDRLQAEWREGESIFPLHVSRQWEAEIARADKNPSAGFGALHADKSEGEEGTKPKTKPQASRASSKPKTKP